MIGLRREAWPKSGSRLRIGWRRLERLRVPVLVVAAALFGAALSAAVLVGAWAGERRSRHAVESTLALSEKDVRALTAENARLQAGLDDSRTAATHLRYTSARLRAEARNLLAANADLITSAGGLRGRGGSLQRRAVSISRQASALGSDVVGALAYVTNTSLGSLDPAYLKAQLDYLKPAVASIRSAADSLGADAGSYADAVDRFAAEAESYAKALRRLADAQATAR